eukprot:gene10027-7004_t
MNTARDARSATLHLEYKRPLSIAYIYIPLVFFLAYVYHASNRVEAEEFWYFKPDYLIRLEKLGKEASRDGEWFATPVAVLCLLLFYLERVMAYVAETARFVYRRKSVLRYMLQMPFLFNFFDAGTAVRHCRACNATLLTSIKYICASLLGGFTQRATLLEAVEEYLKAERRRRERDGETKKNA